MLSSLSWGLHSSSTLIRAPSLSQWNYSKKKGRCSSLKEMQSVAIAPQFELNPPPYPLDSLEPYMSRETLEYHWGRHQRAHVESLNQLMQGTEIDEKKTLEELIVDSYNKGVPLPYFDHAAQAWNHDFFWNSMKPGGGGKPSGILLRLIERDFGSFDRMLKEFKKAASTQFGSGWAWLVYKANKLNVENAVNPRPSEGDNKLMVVKSPNAVNPLIWDYSPLLGIDVWEHAYYLDYENRRGDYVSVFIENLVSWEAVSARLEMAMARAADRAKQDERSQEDETGEGEAAEMYLDSESEEPEAV